MGYEIGRPLDVRNAMKRTAMRAGKGRRRIMLVEPDPALIEVIVAATIHRFDAQVTCAANAADAMDHHMREPHDLIIAELDLHDLDGLELARRITTLREQPIILLADNITSDQAIEAMRLGIRDVFRKPFPVARLLDAAESAISAFEMRQQHRARYDRLRGLVRHVIRERRDLYRRMNLVCRDLVGSHKRLVSRLAANDSAVRD